MAFEIVRRASSAEGLSTWKKDVLALVAPIGFDVAFFESKVPASEIVSAGMDARVLAAARGRWPVYERELAPVAFAARRSGAATDGEVLGAARERTAYFDELVRPHAGRDSLLAPLVSARGVPLGGLVLGRAGARFRPADVARVRALVPALAVGLAAVLASDERRALTSARDAARVTPRETDVLDLVCLGYTNREIGRALDRSPNTVRNQIVSLFRKLGATTRAELVAVTLRR